MDHITEAVAKLDQKNDTHWTEGGKPSLAAVVRIAKDATITQEQLDAAAGDVVRETKAASAVIETKVEETKNPKRPQLTNVLVIATENGYYGSKFREVGEKFTFTGVKGSWMEVYKEDKKKSKDSE